MIKLEQDEDARRELIAMILENREQLDNVKLLGRLVIKARCTFAEAVALLKMAEDSQKEGI